MPEPEIWTIDNDADTINEFDVSSGKVRIRVIGKNFTDRVIVVFRDLQRPVRWRPLFVNVVKEELQGEGTVFDLVVLEPLLLTPNPLAVTGLESELEVIVQNLQDSSQHTTRQFSIQYVAARTSQSPTGPEITDVDNGTANQRVFRLKNRTQIVRIWGKGFTDNVNVDLSSANAYEWRPPVQKNHPRKQHASGRHYVEFIAVPLSKGPGDVRAIGDLTVVVTNGPEAPGVSRIQVPVDYI